MYSKLTTRLTIAYGHTLKHLHKRMIFYMINIKNNYLMFDLVKTSQFLKLAGNIVKKKALEGKIFLFVEIDQSFGPVIRQYAEKCESFHITQRWLGGILTNWLMTQKRINSLNLYLKQKSRSNLLSRKELIIYNRKIFKLKLFYTSIRAIPCFPDIVIFSNPLKDYVGLQECIHTGIPNIGIIDSDCNPALLTYPIPANNKCLYSVKYIINYLVNQILIGNKLKKN